MLLQAIDKNEQIVIIGSPDTHSYRYECYSVSGKVVFASSSSLRDIGPASDTTIRSVFKNINRDTDLNSHIGQENAHIGQEISVRDILIRLSR